jgi:hypothetical protein
LVVFISFNVIQLITDVVQVLTDVLPVFAIVPSSAVGEPKKSCVFCFLLLVNNFIETGYSMLKKFTAADFCFLGASFATIIVSKILYLYGYKEDAIFVGLWTPSIMAFAIYLRVIASSK